MLIKNFIEPPDFVAEPGSLFTTDTSVAPPQTEPQMQQSLYARDSEFRLRFLAPSLTAIAANTPTPTLSPWRAAHADDAVKTDYADARQWPRAPNVGTALSKEIAGKIAGFTGGWAKGGTGSMASR